MTFTRAVADAAALRTGYHRRTFARLGSDIYEIVGGFTQKRDAYGRRTSAVLRKAGTFYFQGRRWKKARQAWAKTVHLFTDAAIDEMVDGWTVALLEASARKRREQS